MYKKTSLTLAATLIAALSMQTTAFASDTSSNVRDHRIQVKSNVRDHRTTRKAIVRDHRTTRKNEVVIVKRKDCRVGYEQLRRTGYNSIVMFDCTGMKYKYIAQKDAAIFHASMHAYSGSMDIRFMGIVR